MLQILRGKGPATGTQCSRDQQPVEKPVADLI